MRSWPQEATGRRATDLRRAILEAAPFDPDQAQDLTKGPSQDERINAQLAELARYSGIDYVLKLKEAAKRIGVPQAVVHQEVEKLRATQVSAAPPPPTLDELAALSSEIIASKDVLGLFAKEYAKVVAGETANAKILYLNGTTRLFEKANHTAVKGTSATGKSWLRTSVVRIHAARTRVSRSPA